MTIIVPVWNRRDLLESLLGCLRALTYPIAELIVVDDGSDDGSAELAESLGAHAIRMPAHGGFAKAVNRGIRESHTPLVAIVNNDVQPEPDWLEKLVAALEPDDWFATGRILQASHPDRIDATYDLLCRGGASWRAGHGVQDDAPFRERRRITSAPLTAALFRAELFEKIGLLDERFESYLEDVDFGLRCALAGLRGCYAPHAVARHQGSATLGRWHPETTRLIARNQVFVLAKHYSTRMYWRYAWPIVVAQTLWGLVALRHGRAWSWLRGKAQGIAQFAEFRNSSDDDRLAEILVENEREIRRLQKLAGADSYWTLYFLLTLGGAK